MADVLFRYLLTARSQDRSWYQRAFLADERLLAAALESLVETAALRVEVASQHARIRRAHVIAWPSRLAEIQFYDQPEPRAPEAPHLETRSEAFPLRETLEVTSCDGCKGTGVIDCVCGTGEVTCSSCQGLRNFGSCVACGGSGRVSCSRCHGNRILAHERCGGEGKIASYQEEIHSYAVKRQIHTVLPQNHPARLDGAIEKWLEEHDEVLPELSNEAITAHLGYCTDLAKGVVTAAERAREVRENRARADSETCLFVETRFRCVPVSACTLRSERSASAEELWLVGRGAQAIELRPQVRPDRWKVAGWPGLLIGLLGGAETFAELHGASLFLSPASLSVLGAAAAGAASLAGMVAAGVGLKRVWFGREDPVRTIVVLPCAGSSTLYLPCLAAVGSWLKRIEILDRSYKATLETLVGNPRPPHQSQTVVMRTWDDRLVRLIEIAQPGRLEQEELARMAQAADGVVFLEDAEHAADALRSNIHGATLARPPEARLIIETGTGEVRSGDATPDFPPAEPPPEALSLETIRRAYIREIDFTPDWPAVFEEMWSPLASVLAGKRPALHRRRAAEAGSLPAEAP
jgi:hypothetical protein